MTLDHVYDQNSVSHAVQSVWSPTPLPSLHCASKAHSKSTFSVVAHTVFQEHRHQLCDGHVGQSARMPNCVIFAYKLVGLQVLPECLMYDSVSTSSCSWQLSLVSSIKSTKGNPNVLNTMQTTSAGLKRPYQIVYTPDLLNIHSIVGAIQEQMVWPSPSRKVIE